MADDVICLDIDYAENPKVKSRALQDLMSRTDYKVSQAECEAALVHADNAVDTAYVFLQKQKQIQQRKLDAKLKAERLQAIESEREDVNTAALRDLMDRTNFKISQELCENALIRTDGDVDKAREVVKELVRKENAALKKTRRIAAVETDRRSSSPQRSPTKRRALATETQKAEQASAAYREANRRKQGGAARTLGRMMDLGAALNQEGEASPIVKDEPIPNDASFEEDESPTHMPNTVAAPRVTTGIQEKRRREVQALLDMEQKDTKIELNLDEGHPQRERRQTKRYEDLKNSSGSDSSGDEDSSDEDADTCSGDDEPESESEADEPPVTKGRQKRARSPAGKKTPKKGTTTAKEKKPTKPPAKRSTRPSSTTKAAVKKKATPKGQVKKKATSQPKKKVSPAKKAAPTKIKKSTKTPVPKQQNTENTAAALAGDDDDLMALLDPEAPPAQTQTAGGARGRKKADLEAAKILSTVGIKSKQKGKILDGTKLKVDAKLYKTKKGCLDYIGGTQAQGYRREVKNQVEECSQVSEFLGRSASPTRTPRTSQGTTAAAAAGQPRSASTVKARFSPKRHNFMAPPKAQRGCNTHEESEGEPLTPAFGPKRIVLVPAAIVSPAPVPILETQEGSPEELQGENE